MICKAGNRKTEWAWVFEAVGHRSGAVGDRPPKGLAPHCPIEASCTPPEELSRPSNKSLN